MLKGFSIFVAIAAMSAACLNAQQPTVNLQVEKTRANDGKQMFVNYCAPCHGVDGRGHGPVAGSLVTAPVDLTTISSKNGGTYPAVHVMAVLKFGVDNPAHGSKQMPIWGPVFSQFEHLNGNAAQMRALRIHNIVQYVGTLQAK